MRSGPLKSHETLRVVARIRGSDVSERKRVRDKFGFYKTFMTESFSDVDNVHEAFDFLFDPKYMNKELLQIEE